MGRVTGSVDEHGFRGAVCSCGADIRWSRTEAGRPMPLDPKPVTTLVPLGEGRVQLRRSYRSHWETCPHSDQHRRRRS